LFSKIIHTIGRDFKKIPFGIRLIVFVVFLRSFGWGFVDPYFSIFIETFGGNHTVLGLLVSSMGVVSLLTIIPLVRLVDKVKDSRIMEDGEVLYFFTILLYVLAGVFKSIPLLIFGFFLNGIAHPLVVVGAEAYIRKHSKVLGDSASFAYYTALDYTGWILGMVIAAFTIPFINLNLMFLFVLPSIVISFFLLPRIKEKGIRSFVHGLRIYFHKKNDLSRILSDFKGLNHRMIFFLMLSFFDGMLAAPRTYAFGTRVKIPGLGVGEVHDRGGRINAYKSHDRIDVWMGRGEEGLSRALNWGARLIEGEVYFTPHQVEPGLSYAGVSSKLTNARIQQLINKTVQSPKVFDKPKTSSAEVKTEPVDEAIETKELQKALTTFGYYHGAINGSYDAETQEAVTVFQLIEGVISKRGELGTGNFGPKTRAALKERLQGYNSDYEKDVKRLEENQSMLKKNLGADTKGTEVLALQRMLWELGYYKGDLTGNYNIKTIEAVFAFQKKHRIVQEENDLGAGYYGNKTHQALVASLNEKIEHTKGYPQEMKSWVPAKRNLPTMANLAYDKNLVRSSLQFGPELLDSSVASIYISTELDLEDKGEEVVKLQNVLIKEGVLQAGLNTGYFGSKTELALIEFQVKKGIVKDMNGLGAGRVGPKTKTALNALI